MEKDVPAKPSVAELAGKFKGHAQPIPTGNEGSKPVRRRPPRTLQISTRPPGQGEEEEKPALTSPLPAKTKRNSALIEKLQANLALSPTSLHPSPKSPGLRLLPPSFIPPSPCSIRPVTTTTPTSPGGMAGLPRSGGDEEPPATFQTPASPTEGTLLPSINKSRARVSIRRRPPSRRHRKSSSGEEVGGAEGEDTPLSTPDGPEEGGKGEEVFKGEEEKEKKKEEEEKKEEEKKEEKKEEEEGAEVVSSSRADANATDPGPAHPHRPTDPAGENPGVKTSTEPQAEEARGGREEGERGEEGGEGPGEEASPQAGQVPGESGEGAL
ncbi:duboraya isoform X2 [Hypomesus transpacificus]|uniref:duboraya isoform X2 n=1 Tax=Hypomesus transpacificus TaxID=137520 RepID=UPI001F08032D|nr:duboraya isoform X2 [Hypomesus transpacificus]